MADVQVNDQQWNALGADAQARIQQALAQSGLGGSIVPSSSGIPLTGDMPADSDASAGPGGDSDCIDRCNTMKDAMMAICAVDPEVESKLACMLVAIAAGAACRAAC